MKAKYLVVTTYNGVVEGLGMFANKSDACDYITRQAEGNIGDNYPNEETDCYYIAKLTDKLDMTTINTIQTRVTCKTTKIR